MTGTTKDILVGIEDGSIDELVKPLPKIIWPLVLAGVFAAVLYLLNVFFQSNLRKLLEYLHLDLILTRVVKYVREHKLLWFLVGLLSGALLTSVALPYLTAANEPYVNPIHDSRVKWNITKWISGAQGNIEPFSLVKLEACNILIVRLADAYPEDFARDWKEIFGAVRWPATEKLADTPIAKGVILRPIQAEGKAVACANALNTTLSQYTLSKRGDPLGNEPHIYPYSNPDVATYRPRECVSPCVEIDIGNPEQNEQ
jgi:hypothetical protein